jgi:hypothetical protein
MGGDPPKPPGADSRTCPRAGPPFALRVTDPLRAKMVTLGGVVLGGAGVGLIV